MSKLTSIFLFLIAGLNSLPAQHLFEKKIESSGLNAIAVNGNHVSKIKVTTNPHSSQIELKASVEGEYQNDVIFSVEELDGQLFIKLVKSPVSEEHNDKLSAHKFIVSELSISLPTDLKLDLKSNIASVNIWGRYQGIRVKLDSGYLEFNGWSGKGEVKTVSADVRICTDNSTIQAISRNGKIELPSAFKSGLALWNIESVNGDISVSIIK